MRHYLSGECQWKFAYAENDSRYLFQNSHVPREGSEKRYEGTLPENIDVSGLRRHRTRSEDRAIALDERKDLETSPKPTDAGLLLRSPEGDFVVQLADRGRSLDRHRLAKATKAVLPATLVEDTSAATKEMVREVRD